MSRIGQIDGREVIDAWQPGWKPMQGWAGPWRLHRSPTRTVWVRLAHTGPITAYFTGPTVRGWPS